MSPNKLSRKQRAAAARAAAALSLSQQQIKKDFLTDGRGRFKAWLWAVSLTFVYATVNNVVLGRPEGQVSVEAFGVCIGTMTLRIGMFYSKTARPKLRHGVAKWMWSAAQYFEQQRFSRILGVSALALVLILNAIPLEGVEPTVATWILTRSNTGLIIGIDSDLRGTHPAYRFREVSARIEKTIKERVPGDPNAVSEVRNSLARIVQNVRLPEDVSNAAKLELAYLQSYETLSRIGIEDPRALQRISSGYVPGVPTVIGAGVDQTTLMMPPWATGPFAEVGPSPRLFTSFTVISFGHNPGSPVPQFAITKGDSRAVVFNDIKIQGLAQDIGNLTWTNVIFQACLIRYHGQPVRMGNVRFFNCTFERSPDGKGQQLLDYIANHQGEPVNAYVP